MLELEDCLSSAALVVVTLTLSMGERKSRKTRVDENTKSEICYVWTRKGEGSVGESRSGRRGVEERRQTDKTRYKSDLSVRVTEQEHLLTGTADATTRGIISHGSVLWWQRNPGFRANSRFISLISSLKKSLPCPNSRNAGPP